VAQIQEVLDLLQALPEDHPIIDGWRERLIELLTKTKRKRKPPGKREAASVDNIEKFIMTIIEIGRLIPEEWRER